MVHSQKLLCAPMMLAAAALICAMSLSVTADVIPITSPDDVPGDIGITFDGLGTGPIEDPFMFFDDGAPTGIVFGDVAGLTLIPGDGGPDARLIDISPIPGTASIEIIFNDAVHAAGVTFTHFDGTPDLAFEAYDSLGVLLGVASSAGLPSGFFGLAGTMGEEFAYVIIHNSTFGFTIDDLDFDPISAPAPGALLLGAMGLGLVGWLKRRVA